jgi:hypothetical protein
MVMVGLERSNPVTVLRFLLLAGLVVVVVVVVVG